MQPGSSCARRARTWRPLRSQHLLMASSITNRSTWGSMCPWPRPCLTCWVRIWRKCACPLPPVISPLFVVPPPIRPRRLLSLPPWAMTCSSGAVSWRVSNSVSMSRPVPSMPLHGWSSLTIASCIRHRWYWALLSMLRSRALPWSTQCACRARRYMTIAMFTWSKRGACCAERWWSIASSATM